MNNEINTAAILCLVLSSLLPSSLRAQEVANVFSIESLTWGPPGGGNGFPEGLRTSRIAVDPDTGAPTYYAMFPPGTHYDLHWHTHDEYVVVVAGKISMQLGDEHFDMEVGDYIVIPGEVNHSWTVPAGVTNAVILVRRTGAPDFFFVEEP